jgi:putative ABC transport system substrate-binding protein
MRLRTVGLTVLALVMSTLAGEAQPVGKQYRVALVFAASPLAQMTGPEPLHPTAKAFVHGLRAFGYVEGQNLILERRSAEGRYERFPDIFQELVRLKVDVIVTTTNAMALEAQKITRTVPIVMAASLNPVEEKLVESLARPGGNITGLTLDAGSGITSKHLGLLRELLPALSRVALLQDAADAHHPAVKETQAAARAHGVTLVVAEHSHEYGQAFDVIGRERPEAVIVGYSGRAFANRRLIVDFATKRHLPLVAPYAEFADVGGLMAYGANLTEIFRRSARYVDRVLKGASPADMPVELPERFELAINLKTAKALGLTIPQALLLQADRVIR